MTELQGLTAADLLATRPLNTRWGVWQEHAFRYAKTDIIALAFGAWEAEAEVTVRIHSTCFAAHYLESLECDCREQLAMAYQTITDRGAGVIVFLEQDGRDNGQVALMRAALYARSTGATQSDAYAALGYAVDSRDYRGAGVVLALLGVRRARLLSNNPRKIAGLESVGIVVSPESHLVEPTNDAGKRFYRDKALEGYLIPPDLL